MDFMAGADKKWSSIMDEQEIRMQCLHLVQPMMDKATWEDVLAAAQKLAEFVINGPTARAPVPR
jgi:hypothetical protein